MTKASREGFLEALAALMRALDELGAPSMVIGGVAVIAHGVPRLTIDIDAAVSGGSVSIDRLEEMLAGQGIVGRLPDAAEFARQHQVFLGVHSASGTPVDISLAWLPFEEVALCESRAVDYAGVLIRIPRPEDLVIYKIIASRAQDIEDARSLLLLHGRSMAFGRIRSTVRGFAEVLEDEERPRVLERLLREAGLEG